MDVPEFFATNPHYVQSGQRYNRNHALSRFVLDLFPFDPGNHAQDRRHRQQHDFRNKNLASCLDFGLNAVLYRED